MEKLEAEVLEHRFAIEAMTKSIKELADTTKDTNKKITEIAKSLNKQEVILEKLANLEINSKDSINRVHKRIYELEKKVNEYHQWGNSDGCPAVRVLKEKEHTADTRLEANIKSNQKRIDRLDNTVTWIARTIIGTLVTGLIGLIFYSLRG